MKPDNTHTWHKLATAGRKRLSGETADSEVEAITWLPGLAAQVHAGFLRQTWRRWALVASFISLVILGYFLVAERMASRGDELPAPRIPIPTAP